MKSMSISLKVLFVSESVSDVNTVTAELNRGGYDPNIVRIESSEAMQGALSEDGYELVISDLKLSQFSAEEALRILRNSGKDIPFIILSHEVRSEEAIALMRHGAHDFLVKESPARLVPAIERELREAAERRQRRAAEERVKTLSLAVEQSPVSVVITDRQGIIKYVNPKFEEITHFKSAEALGRHIDFTLASQASDRKLSRLWEKLHNGESWRGEFCNIKKNGELFWEYANISPLTDTEGLITNFVVVKEDITVRRDYEEQIVKQSHYDELTGLANRVLMIDRLELAIKIAMRNKEQAALFCIDLDGFKNINDTLGHAVGDNLLKEAATRLEQCIRECDTLARMGGDEFVIILPQISDDIIVRRIADRILYAFKEPFKIGDHDHFVTTSIGIVLFPTDGKDHQVLLRNADLAMYKAKDLGKNRYQFFTEEINQKLKHRMQLETRLRRVVAQGELVLHYQPIVDMHDHIPVAYEALVRWKQADGDLYLPSSFIPLAEDVGLINEIGEWVVSTACSEVSAKLGRPKILPRVAINVSPKQLRIKGFASYIKRQLLESGLKPEQLDLEITERVLVDDQPETISISGLYVTLESVCQSMTSVRDTRLWVICRSIHSAHLKLIVDLSVGLAMIQIQPSWWKL